MATIAVALSPVAGFCVKSKATNDAAVHTDANEPIHVKKGLKIFVNIAWDSNVPPPPSRSEESIQRALHGLDIDESDPDAWFVPVVLSDARQDSDKAGQPSIVFDCVFNTSIKSRTLKDPEFKAFIIELALQRIEAQTTLILSRQIGTPNIASKGKPKSRQALVPATLYPPGHPSHHPPTKLIHELPDRPTTDSGKAQPKGILKKSSTPISVPQIPVWSWTQQGTKIRIVFDVPAVTHAVIPESTLDVEPRRVTLHIPSLYELDLNLDAPDAELAATFSKNNTVNAALKLKRMRDLDVNNAKAEWRVADKVLVLFA